MARSAVACDATVTYDSSGRPSRIAATFVDVPPTSTITPSVIAPDRRAPATDAAGPEYSVLAGASRKPDRLVAPPSPRMTMTAAEMCASRTPRSTNSAVRTAIGRIEALTAAVTARNSRPYSPDSSVLAHAGNPCIACDLHDGLFVAIVVGRECLCDRHGANAFVDESLHFTTDVVGRQAIGDIEEHRRRRKAPAGRQFHAGQRRATPDLLQVGPSTESEHTDSHDVTFQQRVDRLGGRVGDEFDVGGTDLGGHSCDTLDDSLGNTRRGVVCGGYDATGNEVASAAVDRDGFGECAADVDTNAHSHLLYQFRQRRVVTAWSVWWLAGGTA